MSKTLLSINEAAARLGVSAKTLRRWEAAGKLQPIRTLGNKRRYSLSDLKSITGTVKVKIPKNIFKNPSSATPAVMPTITNAAPLAEEVPVSQPQEESYKNSAASEEAFDIPAIEEIKPLKE